MGLGFWSLGFTFKASGFREPQKSQRPEPYARSLAKILEREVSSRGSAEVPLS